MNVAIELHDSTVTALVVEPTLVRLTLTAYVHKSLGQPGVDAGTGWLQEARLEIEGSLVQGRFERLPADLSDGWCRVGQQQFDNCIPIPLPEDEFAIQLIEASSGQTLTLTGAKARLEFVGEPEFVEDFPGVQ